MGSTSTRIAEQARAILAEEGSAAVSMRRVAAAVGITPMAIYRHYPDRDALLASIADEIFDELAASWAGLTLSGDFDTQVGQAIDAYLDFALRQPRLYTFLFTEPRAGARRFPGDFSSGTSPTLNIVADLLATGVRRQVLREHDRWEQALFISAQLHGLVQLYHGGRIALPEAEFLALCRRAMKGLLDGIRT